MEPSGGCSSTLARAAAGLFALAFALSLPVALLAFAWGNVLFSSTEMADIIAGELIDSGALQELAVDALLNAGAEQDGPAEQPGALDFLARQDLDQLFAIVIPPGWARSQIEANLESLYRWIDDQRLAPKITLDILPVKQQIQSGGAKELVAAIIGSWPSCGQEQIEVFAREGFGAGELPSELCQPPEPMRAELVGSLTGLIERQSQVLPDQVQPGNDGARDLNREDVTRLKRGLRLLRGLAQVGWLLPVSALGLITALAVRSWPQLLRWWGAAILGGGLATLLAMFASAGVVESALESGPIADLPLISFEPVLRSLVNRLLDETSGRLFVLAFLTTALGVVLLVVGLWLRRRTAK